MSSMIAKERQTVAKMITRRAARTLMVVVAVGGLTSCIDSATQLEREGVAAQTDAIRLYLDNEPVMTIFEDGKITLGPIVFLRTATNVSLNRTMRAELLDREGNVIPNVSPDDVRINIGESSDNWSFTRSDAFTGVIRSTATTLPTTTDLFVGLYDMKQRRVAIGPYTVRITARLP
jgi:hypothetical protein